MADDENSTDLDDEFGEAADDAEEDTAEEAAASDAAPAPGDEMFGDVVEEKPRESAGPREKMRPDRDGSDPAGEDVHLRDSVAGIYEMVKDLEVQLNHMISINEAAERDLEATRKQQRELEKERNELLRKIEKMELDAQSSAELRDELRHMTRENERLIE